MARALFAVTLFTSSALLFFIEPVVGKSLLPSLGGGAAVWTTTVAFFQLALFAGYLYAHAVSARGGARRFAWAHVGALAVAAVWFARASRVVALPAGTAHPTLWLFGTLALLVGAPFVLIAASTPLLHAWLAETEDEGDPYFLFAASNAGSLLALVSYPAIVEPALGLGRQRQLWSVALFPFAALLLACAAVVSRGRRRARPAVATRAPSVRPPWAARLRWAALSAVPSSLLLSVTSYATTDLAALPLLWVLPLAIYLATFVIAFAPRPLVGAARVQALQPFFLILIVVEFFLKTNAAAWPLIPIHGLAFFLMALGCHQTLAATRPAADRSTEFYLWVAAGGALGGLFNVFVAPLAFRTLLEYPLGLVAVALLRPRASAWSPSLRARRLDVALPLAFGAALLLATSASNRVQARPEAGVALLLASLIVPLGLAGVSAYALRDRPLRFGLALAAICVVGLGSVKRGDHVLLHARSFYGVHTVSDNAASSLRTLANGATVHGAQSLEPSRRGEPLAYYTRTGPIGAVMSAWRGQPQRRTVGLVGLGTGALAAYSDPGERWIFFELDPVVVAIARDSGLFSYLSDARGAVDVVLGDARRTLVDERGPFGVLVLDAFSSDAVPAHLLTREALALYLSRLAPHGVIALHLSNHFLDLEPVVGRGAASLGLSARACADRASAAEVRLGKASSLWMVVARADADLAPLRGRPCWRAARADAAAWTDDRSDLWSSLHLRASEAFDFGALSR
ncbi:MAG TPA: fused MFS/spermidine synthase [Polyangia bacterium]|jgi:hypothetical protein|nr:fused MFS/spermidine synthase [Polyangia bacterium]